MRIPLLLTLALVLSACVNVRGSESILAESETLRPPPVAAPAQVFETHGQPHTVLVSEDGGRSWSYYRVRDRLQYRTLLPYIGSFVGGWDVDYTRADFVFDAEDQLVSNEALEKSRYKNSFLYTGDVFTRSRQVRAVREEMERLGLPFDNAQARQMAAVVDRYVE